MVSCFYFGRKDTMPEHYKEHKVRINTIDILEQKVDLMVLLHPSTLTAPGLNMRDYFREFLSCWDMDKILKRIAEDYIEQDRDVIMEEKEEMLWASNMLAPGELVLSDVIFEYTQKDRTRGGAVMVSYPLFLEYVKDNILSFMPEEYSNYCVEEVQALKENGQVFTGISIVKNENGCNPAFYCEGFYKMYQDTQDIDEVMRFIAEQYVKWDKVGAQMALPDPENFEEVKDLIGYSVVNEQLNRDMLKELVHTTVEDLAKVYRVFYMDDEGCKSAKITNELMKGWGISIEELDSIANENMPVLFPPAAAEVSKNNSLTLLERIHNNPEINLAPGGSIYMLTNKYMRGGASVIFYPDLLKTVHAQIQEDFFQHLYTKYIFLRRKNNRQSTWVKWSVLETKNSFRQMMFCQTVSMNISEILIVFEKYLNLCCRLRKTGVWNDEREGYDSGNPGEAR